MFPSYLEYIFYIIHNTELLGGFIVLLLFE